MIAAIHQPNFLPWLGYFRKMARADAFVFLDHVQFPRTGAGTWINRVRVLAGGRPSWLTCPVRRPPGAVAPITAIAIDNGQPWRRKLERTLELNYGRTPFFKELAPILTDLLSDGGDEGIAALNMRCAEGVARLLGLAPAFHRSSMLNGCGDLAGSAALAHICQTIGAQTYLAGDGAAGYEEEAEYSRRGIRLIRNDFAHPVYPQRGGGEFQPGLSIVDALFNIGPEATRRLIAKE